MATTREVAPLLSVDRGESGQLWKSWQETDSPPDYETSFLSDDSLPSARSRSMEQKRKRLKNKTKQQSLSPPPPNGAGYYGSSLPREAGKEIDMKNGDDDSATADEDDQRKIDFSAHTNEVHVDGIRTKRNLRKERIKAAWNFIRVASLTTFVVISMALFSINHEHEQEYLMVSIAKDKPFGTLHLTLLPLLSTCTPLIHFSFYSLTHLVSYSIDYVANGYNLTTNVSSGNWKALRIHLRGPFEDHSFGDYALNDSVPADLLPTRNCSNFVVVCASNVAVESPPDGPTACELLEKHNDTNTTIEHHCVSVELTSDPWLLAHPEHTLEEAGIERIIHVESNEDDFILNFVMDANININFDFSMIGEILGETGQVIMAVLILLLVLLLIIFDLVHRTIAAMIGSTATLGVLSMLNKRPSLMTVVDWISLETICLLFGMMTLVAIFSQTGFFDYFAVKAYKLARGRVWPLISILCIFSAFVSAFLDNVTTILLLTPVSIRLCQVLNLDPKPILIAEVVFSNIGGTATAIGDPPNVIIISHPIITAEGIAFAEFTLHLFIGIIFATVAAYGLLAVYYYFVYVGRRSMDPPHIAELKREIAIWERTARLMPTVSLEDRAVRDALRAKAVDVKDQLNQARTNSQQSTMQIWQKNLVELEERYKITDYRLLIKSSSVLVVIILLFFFSNFIPNVELELGWIALFGAITLLLLSDIEELEAVLNKVEWGTLIFFAALFVLMEGLAELGLIDFIGNTTVDIIKGVSADYQLLVAIVLIVWVSALASSFIDNIPFTQATIPVIAKLAESPEVCLNLRPLVWSLAFGACLGGNGTLIGASANVVCAGLAEQNGYHISFRSFFKIGFPMMILTTFTVTIYLIICHVALGWDVDQASC